MIYDMRLDVITGALLIEKLTFKKGESGILLNLPR